MKLISCFALGDTLTNGLVLESMAFSLTSQLPRVAKESKSLQWDLLILPFTVLLPPHTPTPVIQLISSPLYSIIPTKRTEFFSHVFTFILLGMFSCSGCIENAQLE